MLYCVLFSQRGAMIFLYGYTMISFDREYLDNDIGEGSIWSNRICFTQFIALMNDSLFVGNILESVQPVHNQIPIEQIQEW